MRLIDADALKKDLTRFYYNEVTAKGLIDEQPTIEAEPVVRCKDCENWMNDVVYDDGSCFCPMIDLRTDPGFFCADGERKKTDAT